jgi:hypothetical protein
MNNSTIFTADRTTHLKIVVLSLVASIAVMVVGITTHVASSDTSTRMASGPPIKAGRPIAITNSGMTTVR